MLINDPKKFAIVCSTKNRPAFVRRTFMSLQEQGFKGTLVLVDASDPDPARENREAVRAAQFDAVYFEPGKKGNNWHETVEGMETLESECVLWHHDDDFYFLPAVERALASVLATPEAVSAQGRELFLHAFDRPAAPDHPDNDIYLGLTPNPRVAYLGNTALERLQAALARYCLLTFAVTRREPFIETSRRVAEYFPKEGIFDPYAWTCSILEYGTALLHDDLYALRQKHLRNYSRALGALENWPFLIVNPLFSKYVGDFGACLAEAFFPSDKAVFWQIVYHGVVHLVSRGLGATHLDSQTELKLGSEFLHGEAARKIKALMRATTIGGE